MEDIFRIIPLAGRLNINQEVVNAFKAGGDAYFKDGIDLEIQTGVFSFDALATKMILAGIAYNRYVDSLASMNLSRMMLVYGTHDTRIGRLLEEEISMLERQNAVVVAIPEGGHGSPKEDESYERILKFIRSSAITIDESMPPIAKIYASVINKTLVIEVKDHGTLEVYSLLGQPIFRQNYSGGRHQTSLHHLSSGAYVAIFRTPNGEWIQQKIVVF